NCSFALGNLFKGSSMGFIRNVVCFWAFLGRISCALAVTLVMPLPLAAGPADDPFDLAHRADKSVVKTTLGPVSQQLAKLIDFKADVIPPEAKPGQLVKLRISGVLKPGFHTYPITQRSPDPDQPVGVLSKMIFQELSGLKPLWPLNEPKA